MHISFGSFPGIYGCSRWLTMIPAFADHDLDDLYHFYHVHHVHDFYHGTQTS